jgi:hypothetical protein
MDRYVVTYDLRGVAWLMDPITRVRHIALREGTRLDVAAFIPPEAVAREQAQEMQWLRSERSGHAAESL